jgi:hypoxanthine phosphoribosyltransferase
MAVTPKKPEILFSKAKIQARVDELGKIISKDYEGRTPYLVVVLKGAVVFASDLMRAMTIPVELDFIGISSYGGGTRSTGVVRITKDLDASVESKHVLVVEDIVDSGQTLNYLLKSFQQRRPASLKVASFLVRPDRREVDVAIDYKGFDIPDTFVLGYGMDYRERYRGLPYIFKVAHLPSGDDILFKERDEEQCKK